MAETRAATDTPAGRDTGILDASLFGNIETPRVLHRYQDGVHVEILNLKNDDEESDKSYNGRRVFYQIGEDGVTEVLCRFPGYSIEKYLASTSEKSSTTTDTINAVASLIEGKDGSLCLTNDGPLILVFKVGGVVRLNMMRSANHGFDESFSRDFAENYDGATFEDLFPHDLKTSRLCYIFRQGSRCSAMESVTDMDMRDMLYLGPVECDLVQAEPNVEQGALLKPDVNVLSLESSADILRKFELGLVSFRHAYGELQIMSESYLRRVAVMTGMPVDSLISGNEIVTTNSRPLATQTSLTAHLSTSRFPRVLDFLSLYVLCGVIPGKKNATVWGFRTTLTQEGRVQASPLRGFYNFCRAAGTDPRRELRVFPASPIHIRKAIKNIILRFTLSSKEMQTRVLLENYDRTLMETIPYLLLRVISHGTPDIHKAFEAAFGITPNSFMSGVYIPSTPSITTISVFRTGVMMSDHYKLVTIMRFALRYLVPGEKIDNKKLLENLKEFSTSSRRRKEIASKVAETCDIDPESLKDLSQWPLPCDV